MQADDSKKGRALRIAEIVESKPRPCDIAELYRELHDYYRAGMAYASHGMIKEAEDMVDKLVEHGGDPGAMYWNAINLLKQMGGSQEQIRKYQTALDDILRIATDLANSQNLQGHSECRSLAGKYCQAGMYEKALKWGEQWLAILLHYKDLDEAQICYDYLRRVCYLCERWSEALTYYDKCTRSPDQRLLVLIHMGSGDYEQGQIAYEQVVYNNFIGWPTVRGRIAIAQMLSDSDEVRRMIREVELYCRQNDEISTALWIYRDYECWEELERLCREEYILKAAAYLFEKAGKMEDAARIYEEMAGKARIEHAVNESTIVEKDTASDEKELKKCACGEILQTHWKMCPACGSKLDMVCSCGEPLKKDWKLCPNCGREIRE